MGAMEGLGQVIPEDSFASNIGIKVETFEKDHAVFTMEITKFCLNYYHIVHGGVYFTLADSAAGAAARSDGRKYVTLDSGFHFLRPASGSRLRTEGVLVRRGRTTCLVRADVTDETGKLLATGDFTYYCVEGKP